ncbi:hypothetical protein [uncultured Gemella sp.]|uniref:hypothetical protein n=1 Tax=uncultured Gemella sp. TaxID=254352 RepID=UPI0028D4EC44|nr:hypothetical protein [uncultured Gemella sp.]
MDNLRKRKFNTLYLILTTIAICTFLMTDIDYTRILSVLIGVVTLIFYNFDERGKCVFEEEVEDE